MTITKPSLLAALEQPVRIAQSKLARTAMPRLMLYAGNGRLSVEASDGEQSCHVDVECNGDLSPACVSPSLLSNATSHAGDKIELKPEAGHILFKSNRQSLKLPTTKPDGFQMLPNNGSLIVVPADLLAQGIKLSKFYASPNSQKGIAESVHVVTRATKLACESYNGSQLSYFESAAICGDADFLLPAPHASTVAKLLLEKDAELLLAENLLTVRHSNGHYTCKLMDGKYLNTAMVRDVKADPIGIMVRDEWLEAFRCLKALRSDDETLCVRAHIEFKAKEAAITTDGETFSQTIDGKFSPALVHLNGLPFLDCLLAFTEGADIEVALTESNLLSLVHKDLRIMTTQLRE